MTGYTARKISNLRPNCPILACCPTSHIAEKVSLNFGVKSIITEIYDDLDDMIDKIKELAIKEYNLQQGDLIIITGGFPLGKTHTTNNIRIIEI